MEKKRVKIGKFESMYFFNHLIPISSIADEFLNFILRGLIFANSHFSKFSSGLYKVAYTAQT